MIRIIHLSDLHVRSTQSREENRNAAALVREILARYKAGPKLSTIVVITGDLVDDGKINQYKQVRKTVLAPLEKAFRVLTVPGNHDYALWGNLYDRRAPGRFNTHVRAIPKYPHHWVNAVKLKSERKLVLIGVDSADPAGQAFFADGIVDQQQRASLEAILLDAKYASYFKVLYIHHHPFLRDWFVSFKEADQFLGLIRKRVDLVLFGHKHVHEVFLNRYQVPTMLASGKVTQSVADALAFRVIELEKNGPPNIYTVEVPRA